MLLLPKFFWMEQSKNTEEFDSTNLLVFLYNYRKPLIILSIAAALISAAVSFMIREKYLSTVVLFPASTSSISKSIMTEDAGGKNDIVAFGEEEQAEQMLQILNSDEIREIGIFFNAAQNADLAGKLQKGLMKALDELS